MSYPINPWDPFAQFNPFRVLERWFAQLDPGVLAAPAMGMQQTDSELILRVEVPGISPEDLEVTQVGDQIHVRGTWRGDSRQGTFQRAVTLPPDAAPEQATASYSRGVLEIRIPRREGPGGRHIPIDLK